jgi:ABC-type Mn2+/Zn2+ transport system permease subunit
VTERTFYSAAAAQLNLFLGERENRVAKAETEIPAPLLGLLIFLAITTICVSFLIRTNRRRVDITLVVVVSVIIGAGLLTALILQYPYSGAIAVDSDPLVKGPLAHLRG